MSEKEFAELVADFLRPKLAPKGVSVQTKKSLLYSLTIDEAGTVKPKTGEPIRGQDAFEQDIVIYEETSKEAYSPVIPRVVIETKLERVTTHDALTYSQKALRLKAVYPYLRYVLLIGGANNIAPRVLKHGTDFDLIFALQMTNAENLEGFITEINQELDLSRKLPAAFRADVPIKVWRRRIQWS